MTNLSIEAELDKIVDKLKTYPKVVAIVLFGSYARKKTKPLSDVDIAVIVKNPDRDLEAEISSSSSNVFDVVVFSRLPLYIQFEVLKHGEPLFVGDEQYFAKIKREVLADYLEMSYLYERMSERVLA